jgi:hypothetical protein
MVQTYFIIIMDFVIFTYLIANNAYLSQIQPHSWKYNHTVDITLHRPG